MSNFKGTINALPLLALSTLWAAELLAVPVNDDVVNATSLAYGNITIFDNSEATAQTDEVAPPSTGCNRQDGWCDSGIENSLWYTFTASSNITQIDASSDTQLAVWSVSDVTDWNSFTLMGANDDSSPLYEPFGPQVTLNNLTAGDTYYIQLDGYGGDILTNGEILLSEFIPPTPPVNDNVADAIILDSNVVTLFDNTNATAQTGEVAPPSTGCNTQDGWCESGIASSLWYTFEATDTFATIDAVSDMQLAVWTVGDASDWSTFDLVGANDDSSPLYEPYGPRVTLDSLTIGQTYYVQLDGYAGFTTDNGEIQLTMANAVPEPSSLLLLGLGGLGLGLRRRNKQVKS